MTVYNKRLESLSKGNVMNFAPDDVRPAVFYQQMIHSIVPRPIAWVSTISASEVTNVAPFSYFTGVGSRPASLLFCPANGRDGAPKDTLQNIQQVQDFVVNVVPRQLAEQMNSSAEEFPADVSEFTACGITAVSGLKTKSPRVAECPVSFECELMEILNLGKGPGGANVVIGKVVQMHIDDRVLGDTGLVAPELLDAIGRMGGSEYCRTDHRFELKRP